MQDTAEKSDEESGGKLNGQVRLNKPGWYALQFKDGGWVGNERGVPCYKSRTLARLALTILWQRDGGRGPINYKIEKFTHANVITGEFTPRYSAEQALNRYTRGKRDLASQSSGAIMGDGKTAVITEEDTGPAARAAGVRVLELVETDRQALEKAASSLKLAEEQETED